MMTADSFPGRGMGLFNSLISVKDNFMTAPRSSSLLPGSPGEHWVCWKEMSLDAGGLLGGGC